MSDLDITKQPTHVPVLATDETYDTPGEDWDGTETRTALSTGDAAQGLLPNTDLDAQTLNDLIGRLGDGLASIVDYAAANWSPARLADNDTPSFAGMGNGLFAGPTVLPMANLPGATIARDQIGVLNNGGLYYSQDGFHWTNAASLGFSGAASDLVAVDWYDGSDHVVNILVYAEETATWKIRHSDNNGASWATSGQIESGAEGASPHVMGAFSTDWGTPSVVSYAFWCARSQLYYQLYPFGGTSDWTRITTSGFWTGAPPPSPSCFAASPTEAAIGILGSPYVIHTTDGTSWAAAGSGLAGSILSLHWSEAHQLWIARSNNGNIYTAPAGMAAWTSRAFLGTSTTLGKIASLGRAIVATDFPLIKISRDLTHWVQVGPLPSSGVDFEWKYALTFNGAVWVAQKALNSGAAGSVFEFFQSGVLPAELRNMKAW